jgi:hypothetical protein
MRGRLRNPVFSRIPDFAEMRCAVVNLDPGYNIANKWTPQKTGVRVGLIKNGFREARRRPRALEALGLYVAPFSKN